MCTYVYFTGENVLKLTAGDVEESVVMSPFTNAMYSSSSLSSSSFHSIPFKSQWRELINSGVSALSLHGAKGENIRFACKHYIVMRLYTRPK